MTDESPWGRIIGPCHTLSSMARALGRTEAAVIADGDSLRLLMLSTDDGTRLFPAFQTRAGVVVEGLAEVLRVLQAGVDDPWTWAQWLNTAPPDSDLLSSIEMLYDGRLDEVIRDARHDAWAWSS